MIFKGKRYALIKHKNGNTCNCSNCDIPRNESFCSGRLSEEVLGHDRTLCNFVEETRGLTLVTFKEIK